MHQIPKQWALGVKLCLIQLTELEAGFKGSTAHQSRFPPKPQGSIPAVHLHHHNWLTVPREVGTSLPFFVPQDFSYFFLRLSSLLHGEPGTWLCRGGLIITIRYLWGWMNEPCILKLQSLAFSILNFKNISLQSFTQYVKYSTCYISLVPHPYL